MSFDARVDTTPEVVQEETPQVLTVSQILNDLENGIDRVAMRKKYDLTMAEIKHIFTHPKLQGVRVKKQKLMRVQLIDDTETLTDPNQTSIPTEVDKETHMQKLLKTPSLEEATDMLYGVDNKIVDVQSFPSTGQWNDNNDNQTEIKD